MSATSVLIYLRSAGRPDPQAPASVYRLDLDDRVWIVETTAGRVTVTPGEPTDPDATLRTDPRTLNTLLEDPSALSRESVTATGDLAALRSLLRSVSNPMGDIDT